MQPAVLIGYTIEKSNNPHITRRFLNKIWNFHTANNLPATFFLLGKSIETNYKDLEKFCDNPLFDFAQHTYSHIGFKTIRENRGDGKISVLLGESLCVIKSEVMKTNKLIKKYFSKACHGVEGARGYYMGISDRPDVVETLLGEGFKYSVTYCRNEFEWNPVDLSVQPFFYENRSETGLLELPNQGWQDAAYIKVYGEELVKKYYDYCERLFRRAALEKKCVSFIMHDWTNDQWDNDFSYTASFYESVMKSDMPAMNFYQYYSFNTQVS